MLGSGPEPVGKVVLLIISGLGVGQTPDAALFNDRGANTLANLADARAGLKLPNFSRLGLGNLTFTQGVERPEETIAYYGKMRQGSDRKDNMSGTWELLGLDARDYYYRFSEHLPEEMLQKVNELCQVEFLGNFKPDKEKDIFLECAEDHISSERPILYLTNDSQICLCAHEKIYSLEQLRELAHPLREFTEENQILITTLKTFKGDSPYFEMADSEDSYLPPPVATILFAMKKKGVPVYSLGGAEKYLNKEEITFEIGCQDDKETISQTMTLSREGAVNDDGQCFVISYLHDFNNAAREQNLDLMVNTLEKYDHYLPRIMRALNNNDILIVTSDHGADATLKAGSTREHVPIMCYSRQFKPGRKGKLGVRKTLSDVADTLARIFDLEYNFGGESFWSDINPQASSYVID